MKMIQSGVYSTRIYNMIKDCEHILSVAHFYISSFSSADIILSLPGEMIQSSDSTSMWILFVQSS